MLSQHLQLKLQQKLSPQQILLMKLLQIPAVGLEQRIKQEIEENPALEVDAPEVEELDQDQDQIADEETPETDEYGETVELDNYKEEQKEFDVNDYSDDDIPSYKLKTNNYSPDDQHYEIPFVAGKSFHDLLIEQLGIRNLTEDQLQVGIYIIGNIDDSGYLERSTDAIVDDLAFTQNIITDKNEVESILKIIQEFDPSGVGARNLQECLLIQLQRKQLASPSEVLSLSIKIIRRYFNEFTKKHYSKIMKRAEISEEQLKSVIDEVLTLNPKPGNSLSETTRTNHYIIPDFTITNANGKLELSLNSWNNPDLRVSNDFSAMGTSLDKKKKNKEQRKAFSFVKQKIDSAKWFIEAIRQRQNTLYSTMNAIMEYQHDYFMTGDSTKLRPLILKDIAEMVDLDISTISRVTNSKYVQTDFGTFLLKSFFSEGMEKDDGEEVSTREIKGILQEIVAEEEKKKPLTDEHLAGLLKEKGYPIARRTIAKYREQLGIPVARLRKEL